MSTLRKIASRIALLLLAICRGVYCWVFFFVPLFGFHVVYKNVLTLIQTRSVTFGDVVSNVTIAAYSIVWWIAWWTILRKKHTARRWAIAANSIMILNFLPGILGGKWRAVLRAELEWWPFIIVGIFGILIFSVPCQEWRGNHLAEVDAATSVKA